MRSRPYSSEAAMYPAVAAWLLDRLTARFPSASVHVADTHNVRLNEYISRRSLGAGFADSSWQTFEIQVDVTGFVTDEKETRLHFVECKLPPLSLAHLSQLLGYCRVALPTEAWLLSPAGVGSALISLVTAYARRDVLEYDWPERRKPRHIAVARWNADSRSPDPAGALPTGAW